MAKFTKFAVPVASCLLLAMGALAQTKPSPGPTVPEKRLPVPKAGEDLVINPTIAECKAGWRPGLQWTKEQFDRFCAQLHISK